MISPSGKGDKQYLVVFPLGLKKQHRIPCWLLVYCLSTSNSPFFACSVNRAMGPSNVSLLQAATTQSCQQQVLEGHCRETASSSSHLQSFQVLASRPGAPRDLRLPGHPLQALLNQSASKTNSLLSFPQRADFQQLLHCSCARSNSLDLSLEWQEGDPPQSHGCCLYLLHLHSLEFS